MSPNPRDVLQELAQAALAQVAAFPGPLSARACAGDGERGVMVLAWSKGLPMPAATVEPPTVPTGEAKCRADILAALRSANAPLTVKKLVSKLRELGTPHGKGTVEKVAGRMTGTEPPLLVNLKDKKGYRLTEWLIPLPPASPPPPPPPPLPGTFTPDLFD